MDRVRRGRGHYLFALVTALTLLVQACGPSAGKRETTESVANKLSHLSIDQLAALGPHRSETILSLSTKSHHRSQLFREQYDLQWDRKDQYRYRVTKGDFLVMDVTVWKGRVYQRDFGGRLRIRDDASEVSYYLRRTWNQWPQASEVFKPVLVYEHPEKAILEGRPVVKYRIGLHKQIDPNPKSNGRMRQAIEHDRAEGAIWIDDATGVPLRIDFVGEYRVIRFARGSSGRREETRHRLEFRLVRQDFGMPQVTASPALARSNTP